MHNNTKPFVGSALYHLLILLVGIIDFMMLFGIIITVLSIASAVM